MPFDFDRYRSLRRSTSVGAEVVYRASVASTMDEARAGASAGMPPGTAYVAGTQTAGRGREGRTWISAAEAGLYVTFHLIPAQSTQAPLLSIAGALAVADALRATCGLAVDLKWPNDVLHRGRKLCGVLAEARHNAGRADVFLGIGVNLTSAPELPEDVALIATSVAEAGAEPPSREALVAALSATLERRAMQAQVDVDGLIADWRGRLVTLGRRVRLHTPAGDVEGEAVDVTAAGELVLRLDSGEERAFAAGDALATRDAPAPGTPGA
ncbi:MAG: biotin--[acetyl-CoA-carboxylase] ligase [Dehalococcoidia bacterium]